MTFSLDTIVPWGRSFEEYVRLFDLDEVDLQKRILGCADGPAGFNSGLTSRGGTVISCDPLYRYSGDEIRARINACGETVLGQVRENPDLFLWKYFRSPEELGRSRFSAMYQFLADYEAGRREGRYYAAVLPNIPFRDDSFDLAVCSHLLFYYSSHLSLSFHQDAIKEMLRVSPEARIFPLVDLNGLESSYIDPVVRTLQEEGYMVEIRPVDYEFIRGGNQLMVVTRRN